MHHTQKNALVTVLIPLRKLDQEQLHKDEACFELTVEERIHTYNMIFLFAFCDEYFLRLGHLTSRSVCPSSDVG